jgi:hypothetical protein
MTAGYPEYLGKFATPAASPFARTLFFDADCLAIGSFAEVWERLAPARVAVHGHYVTAERRSADASQSLATIDLIRRFGLTRYFKNNLGLIYFTREDGRILAETCMRLRNEDFGGRMTCDEVLVGIAAERCGLTAVPKPRPMPWSAHEVVPDETGFRLVHFIGNMRGDTLTWLLRGVRRRRAAAGLPPEASALWWFRKVTGRTAVSGDPRIRFSL